MVGADDRMGAAGVRRLSVALPLPQPSHVNLYLLQDPGTAILVDAAMPGSRPEVERLLSESRSDPISAVVITHEHLDHFGLAGTLCPYVILHPSALASLTRYRDGGATAGVQALVQSSGLPHVLDNALVPVTASEALEWAHWSPRPLQDGATLGVGERTWEVIATPGHSPGHICLFERATGVLICGDLFEESLATVGVGYESDDPVGDYLESLTRVEQLPVRVALPGHGEPISDVGIAARRMRRRLRERLRRVERLLGELPTTTEVSDELFPNASLVPVDLIAAMTEAAALLRRLEAEGRAVHLDEGRWGRSDAGGDVWEDIPALMLLDEHIVVRGSVETVRAFLSGPTEITSFFPGVSRIERNGSLEIHLERHGLRLEVLRESWASGEDALVFESRLGELKVSGHVTLRSVIGGTELWVHAEIPDSPSARGFVDAFREVVPDGLSHVEAELGVSRR